MIDDYIDDTQTIYFKYCIKLFRPLSRDDGERHQDIIWTSHRQLDSWTGRGDDYEVQDLTH